MTNMLQSRSNGERAHTYWPCIHIMFVKPFHHYFKIKKKPNTPMTTAAAAAAAKAKSNSSSKQTEYKLMVGCCMVGLQFT